MSPQSAARVLVGDGAARVLVGDGAAGSDDHHRMTKQKNRLEHHRRPKPTLVTKPSNNHSHIHQSTKRTVHLLLLPSSLDYADVGTASPPTCTVAEAVFVAAKGRRWRDKKKEEVICSPRQIYIEEELMEVDEDGDEERSDTILEHNHDDSGYVDEEKHYDQEDDDEDELEEAEVENEFELDDEETESENDNESVSSEEEEEGNQPEEDHEAHDAGRNTSGPSSSSSSPLQNKGSVTKISRILDAQDVGFPFVISRKNSNQRLISMDVKWHHWLDRLVEYHKQSGTWVIPKNQNDKKLYNWVHAQRNWYRRGVLQKKNPKRYQALLQAGFPFEKDRPNARTYGSDGDEKWKSRLEELTAYYSQYKTKSVSRHSHPDLYHWALFQVRSFRNGKMAPPRIKKLRAIGCPLDKRSRPPFFGEQQFQNAVEQLVQWHSTYGTWHVKHTENLLLYQYVLKFTFDSSCEFSSKKYEHRCKAWRTPARIAQLRAVGFPIDDYLSSSSDAEDKDEKDTRVYAARKRTREADQEHDHDVAAAASGTGKKKKNATSSSPFHDVADAASNASSAAASPYWCVKRINVTCEGKSADSFELEEPLWFRSSLLNVCIGPPSLSYAGKEETKLKAEAERTQATVAGDSGRQRH
jgi:hypothetical protein